jgi:hypothetical protein
MTAAAESESFLLCQPHWAPFLSHVRRAIGPLRAHLETILQSQRRNGSAGDGRPDPEVWTGTGEELVAGLAARVQRFCQEALIAFPKSLATAGRSPRYQDSLKGRVATKFLIVLREVRNLAKSLNWKEMLAKHK